MRRCTLQGKKKYRDAGHAARYIRPGEHRGFYHCRHCGFYHLTKRRQAR